MLLDNMVNDNDALVAAIKRDAPEWEHATTDTGKKLCYCGKMKKGEEYSHVCDNVRPTTDIAEKKCKCGRPIASPFSEIVCSYFPHCEEDVPPTTDTTEKKWTTIPCPYPEHRARGCNVIYNKGSLFDCFEKLYVKFAPTTDTSGWREQAMQLVGEASMCWDDTGSAIFDSNRAIILGEKFHAVIKQAYAQGKAEQLLREHANFDSIITEWKQRGFDAGRAAERARLRALIERRKLLEVAVSTDRLLYKQRWNAALSDLLDTLKD